MFNLGKKSVFIRTCPDPRNLQIMAPETAASTSAESNTINGALPPSSMETRLTVSADCFSRI